MSNTVLELVQARLLAAVFSQDVKGQMALKGGMAMRSAHGSLRYTKDIDLAADPEHMSPARVAGVVRSAFKRLQASGALSDAQLSEPKQTDTTQRWKLSATVGKTPINLTVEVSRRDPLPIDHIKSVSWAPPKKTGLNQAIMLDVYDIHALAATKVSCLCDNKREAPRDIMDLQVLISLEAQPKDMIRKMGVEKVEQMLDSLWGKLEKMDWQTAKDTLFGSLTAEAAEAFDRDAWQRMRLEVGVKVENWLKEVQDELQSSDIGMRPA